MNTTRFWQIDVARGIAVVGMVAYHFLVDLEMIFHLQIGVYKPPLVIFARIVALLFILLVGASAAIKYEKLKTFGFHKITSGFAKKALQLLLCAGVITTVTFVMFRDETIVMGILHFIGISMLLIVPFLLLDNKYLIFFALLFLIIGVVVPNIETTSYWLLPLGIVPKMFSTLDFFPLFPWFGIILIGVVAGRMFKKKQIVLTKVLPDNILLAKIGQKSLMIYLLHQPILWSGLWITERLFSNK